MTNFEYYKENILDIYKVYSNIAVVNGRPVKCMSCNCEECDFYNPSKNPNCYLCRYEWLSSKYVEKPTLTEDEYHFLVACKSDCYIARDENGELYLFENEPIKKSIQWIVSTGNLLNISYYQRHMFDIGDKDGIFPFIKWEDKKPWKVEDLLKLEVK